MIHAVHYKSDETVNFCDYTYAITSPITVFINFVFYIYFYSILRRTLSKVSLQLQYVYILHVHLVQLPAKIIKYAVG